MAKDEFYEVSFCSNDEEDPGTEPQLVFRSSSDVEAIQFALSMHQASNVAHDICVINPLGSCICEMTKVNK